MTEYRRCFISGGTYFFTVNLAERSEKNGDGVRLIPNCTKETKHSRGLFCPLPRLLSRKRERGGVDMGSIRLNSCFASIEPSPDGGFPCRGSGVGHAACAVTHSMGCQLPIKSTLCCHATLDGLRKLS